MLALPNADSVARAHALTELERFDEAIAIAGAALHDSDAQADERARLQYSIAYALWSKGQSDTALAAAWEVVSLHPANEDAMWLIREIEQQHSRNAMQFRLIAEGQQDGRRFLVTSEVVADDEQEARDLAMRFEPESVRSSIIFEEVKKLHRAADLPKGVYWAALRLRAIPREVRRRGAPAAVGRAAASSPSRARTLCGRCATAACA